MAAPGRSRPGRSLAMVALVLVALYLGLFLGPSTTPALGLDLRGGTQVTLTAQPLKPGGKIDKSALQQAVNIIRQRTNGLGVGGAEISTQGNTNIVVSVPGKGRDQVVQAVGQTALLRFRQVLQYGGQPQTVTTTPSPSGTSLTRTITPSPQSTKSGKPSTKHSSHGDALTSVLTGSAGKKKPASTKSPSPSPSTSASASPGSAQQSPSAYEAPSLTPSLTAAFNALDCTKNHNPTKGQDVATDYIVGCGTAADGYPKYLLAPSTLAGTDVKSASSGLQPNTVSQWQVNLSFTGSGGSKWFDLTKKAYEADPGGTSQTCKPPTGCNAVAIVLDGVVESAPRSESDGIPGNSAQITGNFTQSEANQLAEVLKYGALPLKFTQQDVQSVSATLGAAQLRGGLIAGIIGLGLVIVFSLLYYRALGLVTVGSLAVSGLILYAVTTLLGHSSVGYTLSLPGIAGFIVAVGITADSFVVFFERLRDEIREGRRLRSGVERAWPRARRTIVSADFVSLLAAVVLYIVSIGDVRGFAFTLGLSTLSDLFIVFFFTKPLLTVMARSGRFDSGRAWTGIGSTRVGVARDAAEPARSRRPREA